MSATHINRLERAVRNMTGDPRARLEMDVFARNFTAHWSSGGPCPLRCAHARLSELDVVRTYNDDELVSILINRFAEAIRG